MAGRTFKITPARAEWLRKLKDGPARRRGYNQGRYCMVAGWTDWLWQRGDELLLADEMRSRYATTKDAMAAGWNIGGLETLTAKGRAAIEAYDRATERGDKGDE